jgi:hypothetical protein
VDPRPGRRGDRRPRKFYEGVLGELAEAAEHDFRLLARQPDGETLRTHLEAAAARGNARAIAAIEGPECPEAARHVWGWFQHLSSRRGSNGFGLNALTYLEVDAWARLRGIRPEPWELEALFLLDALYLVATRPKAEAKQ